MASLKSWSPFRFSRHNKKRPDARPAKISDSSNGGLTIADVRAEMDRMLDRVWSTPPVPYDPSDRWFGDFRSPGFLPRLDVRDDADFLKFTLEAPGVQQEDLDIEVQDGVLIVTGEKNLEETGESGGCYRTARSYGSFRRAIPLPDAVDPNKAQAVMDKGVVTIKMPKSESAKKQTLRIPVNN